MNSIVQTIIDFMNQQEPGFVVPRKALMDKLSLSRGQMDRATKVLESLSGLSFTVESLWTGKAVEVVFEKLDPETVQTTVQTEGDTVQTTVQTEGETVQTTLDTSLEQAQPTMGDFLNMSEADKVNADYKEEFAEAVAYSDEDPGRPEAVLSHYRALGASLGLVGEPGDFRMPEPEKAVQTTVQTVQTKPEALFRAARVDTKTKAFEAALEYRSTAMSVWNVTRQEAEDFAATCSYPPGAEYLSEKQRFAWAIDALIGNKALAARGR